MTHNYQEALTAVLSETKLVHDCVLCDPRGDLLDEPINIEWIIKIHGDLTGFEASVNEIVLNENSFSSAEISEMAQFLLKGLRQKYPSRSFCIIISIDNQNAVIRFHTAREEETMWCDMNLENYNEPVLVEIE